MDYDTIIIGSGFGGSVPALRLSEKGYRVAVLEQGRRVSPTDMRDADRSLRKLFWIPRIGFRGFFVQHFFRHVGIVGGVGVGGGSLVYAAVLLKPADAFFTDAAWAHLGTNWKRELEPRRFGFDRSVWRFSELLSASRTIFVLGLYWRAAHRAKE